jgi:hypothetical protein
MKLHRTNGLAKAAFGLGLCLAMPGAAFAQGSGSEQMEECQVGFSSGTTLENDTQVSDCVEEFKELRLTRIEVMGYASPDGSMSANRALSQRRADMVSTRIAEAFPGIQIDARGMGPDEARGRAVIVTAFYSEDQTNAGATTSPGVGTPSDLGTTTPNPAVTAIDPITGRTLVDESSNSTAGASQETPSGSVQSFPPTLQRRGGTRMPDATGDVAAEDFASGDVSSDGSVVAQADGMGMGAAGATTDSGTTLQRENIPSGWNDVRFAGRVGYDYQWDRDEYMNALGAELSYVRRNLGTRLARLEVGATTSFLGDFAEDMKAYNFHGTIFPALEAGPLVVGPRGLLGGSWEDREKEVVLDAGGEGRLGVEAANYSVFVSAGRTISLTRVALDVGATF